MEMGSIAHLLEIASSQFSTFNAVVQIQDAHRRQGLQLMAHGLFSQIHPIILNTEHSLSIIQDPTLMPDERNTIVEGCAQDLQALQDLLHAVYSISRPAEFERTPVQIKDQIEQTMSGLRSDDIGVHIQCENEMPRVQASEQVISQIWPALFHNSVEAHSTEIHISLRIGICRRTQMRGQPAVVVQFRDNGSGIPQDLLSAATIPMFTTKDGHSGLGLSMVQHIMDVHNGEFGIHSTPNNGCTITLRFPIARQNQ